MCKWLHTKLCDLLGLAEQFHTQVPLPSVHPVADFSSVLKVFVNVGTTHSTSSLAKLGGEKIGLGRSVKPLGGRYLGFTSWPDSTGGT